VFGENAVGGGSLDQWRDGDSSLLVVSVGGIQSCREERFNLWWRQSGIAVPVREGKWATEHTQVSRSQIANKGTAFSIANWFQQVGQRLSYHPSNPIFYLCATLDPFCQVNHFVHINTIRSVEWVCCQSEIVNV